ncbi:hypothetical protein NCS55_00613900 [Fusarium keratoplasticum]|nr:hypothetical protein NCS55_00613900 [Fusarium keratoplasticum]
MTDACQAGPNNCGDQTIKGEKFCEKRALIPSRLMKQRLTNPDAECTDPDCHVRFEPYNLRYSQIGGDRWFCPDHACTEGGCYKRRRDSVTLFCAAHAKENQCSKLGCEEIRVPDGQLCKQHTCNEPGCLLEVYPQGQNGQMCSQHQPCGYAGCRRFTPLDGNGHPEKLCAYHHLCRAPGDPCDGIVDGNSDYCPQHKCGVMGCNRCRDNLRVPENRWCTPRDAGASVHDWRDPTFARVTRAAIEDVRMPPGAKAVVASSTVVGGTSFLGVTRTLPTAADGTDTTSRDAMTITAVLDESALATAGHEDRRRKSRKTTGTTL